MSKPFTVNIDRHIPYMAYRFLVYFIPGTSPVAGISKVTGLKRTSKPIEYREGGNGITLKTFARTEYEAITLERGITYDSDFEDWANSVQALDSGSPTNSLKNFRRDIRIELLNEAGVTVHRYWVHRAWVSEYQALPDLDAGGSAIALEHVKIENEGWEKINTPEQAET